MLAGAYSNRFRLLQEQQITNLKALSAAAAAAGDATLENDPQPGNKNGKSRQLSLETNKRRKLQEMRWKMVALKEEKRCQEILLQRRQSQQEATERFQRAPLQNKNRTKGKTNLEELLCIIRGGTALINDATRQQRSSSARVFSKERDKRDNSRLHGTNKLLTNRPCSQPGRPVANAYLHDQSLRNLTNSRNLFEQQLRRKQNQRKECEQVVTVAPRNEEEEEEDDDTDSDNNDSHSINAVEERRHEPEECNPCSKSAQENGQKETKSSHLGFSIEPKRIDGQSNLSVKEGTVSREEEPRWANGIQQQIPCVGQKSPSIISLASGDSKNASSPLQASFRKTAWIQPSMAPHNGLDLLHSQMPAWVSQAKAEPHFDAFCQNPKETGKDQSCNHQQQQPPNRTLPRDKQPICGAPVKQATIFQPKHNLYERQLSTPFYPIASGHSQQRPIWITEREQPQIFPTSFPTEQSPNQTRPHANPDNAVRTAAVSHLKSNNKLAMTEKNLREFTKMEENKLQFPQGSGLFEQSQPTDYLLKLADKSETNNDVRIPTEIADSEALRTKQTQLQNFQSLGKSRNTTSKKNHLWQESDRKTVPKKLSAGHQKAVRGILKVTSTDNGSAQELNINGTQRHGIRDSLEITRQLFNQSSRETIQAKIRSKSAKKHVHFACEDQFYEVDDEEQTAAAAADEVVLNEAEDTVKNPSLLDNHNQIQQCNNNGNDHQKVSDRELDKKEIFCKKPLQQKPQVNWLRPSGRRPQAKAHIIKQTPQTAEEESGGYQIPDPTLPNGTWSDKKNVNTKSLGKNNNPPIQHITMGTLKKLASNNQGVSNARKESRTTMMKEPPAFVKSGFAVDQTPTDDEINWLWDKVQGCLQQKPTIVKSIAQTMSETKPMLSHMYLDGCILGQTNGLCTSKTASPSLWYPPSTYNGGLMSDGKATSNYAKKLTFLQQRASSFAPRGPTTAHPEKVSSLPSESDAVPPNTVGSRYLDTSSKEVTGSLAGFLKAEELSQMASVSDSQALVAIKEAEIGLPQQGGASSKYRGGPPPSSFLSLEEKRLMESLERINNKLKGCCTNQTAQNGFLQNPFLTDQLQGLKVPPMRYHAAQLSPQTQPTPKGWLNESDLLTTASCAKYKNKLLVDV